MPALRIYRVFISHCWDYRDEYYRLVGMLNEAPNFLWQDYSVPWHDPLDAKGRRLMDEIYDQIKLSQIVIILSGMYVTHSDMIQNEIKIAQGMSKPIIGIVPWGGERIPQVVQDAAHEIVRWNTQSIVDAIRRWAL